MRNAIMRTATMSNATTRKMYQRRRRTVAVLLFVLAVVVLLVGHLLRGDDEKDRASTTPAGPVLPSGPQPPAGADAPDVAAATKEAAEATTAAAQAPVDTLDAAPTRGAAATGGFTFVHGYGPVLGTTGTVRRFKVAVENSIGQGNGGDFADEVDRILGDPRSWIAGGQLRLQRVPQSAASEFTIYLASADTSEKMCAQGGLKTDGYTSCRLPGQVIINVDRWQDAIPDYGAPLETYRAYAINHEVGHQLGHNHEACPGTGKPAPVMMQQTYGLQGCVANSWPYLDGKRYAGSPIA
jgi:hypothetical protein